MSQEQSNEPKPGDHDLELGIMNKGDYMIHIFVESGKNFVLSDDDSAKKSFNACIQLNCAGKKEYSKTLKDMIPNNDNSRYWGQHFFFEPKNMSSDAIQSQVIEVKVLDKGFLRDSMVGMFDIDLSQVYFQNNEHAIFNQWVAISNPESQDNKEIKGYLQLSIAIQGPGDNAVKLSESQGLEDPATATVLMPASIRKDYKQLSITIIEAQNLPKMDTFGTIDAYVKTKFNKFTYKTKVVNPKNAVCEFNQVFQIPLQWPISNDQLMLNVWDYEKTTPDECAGTIEFSFKQLVKNCSGPEGQFRWENIYGAPVASGFQGPNQEKMNKHPEIASMWKGRILFHIQVADSNTPKKGVFDIDPIEFMGMKGQEEKKQLAKYQIQFEIGAGICLPGKEKYRVRLQTGKFVIDSDKPIDYDNQYALWNQRIENKGFESPCQTIEELDRIYIYLLDDGTPICFWKGQASDFINRNPEFRWLPLTNDLAVGKIQDANQAGMVQIKLTINPLKNNPQLNFEQFPNWNMPIPRRQSKFILRCFIFQCKDLPSADAEGSSDVYLKVWNQRDKEVQTKVIDDNLNPIFYEAHEIKLEINDLYSAPPIVFSLWDRDDDLLNLDDDDFLGFTKIMMTDANIVISSADISQDKRTYKNKPNMNFTNDSYELKQIPTPKWHDVKSGFQDNLPSCGQVLCSFVLIEEGTAQFSTPLNELKLSEKVQIENFNVDINVLGLRDLQSFGIIPIKKPFIQFNIRSLLPPERAEAVSNIKTAPKSSGNNPVINQMISFSSILPTEELYCPKLSCEVYDYICKGLSQPIVGSFVVDIGKIMHEQTFKREDEISSARKCIRIIKDKIESIPQFTGDVNSSESIVSSQMNYAKSVGYDMAETLNAFQVGIAKSMKYKKKKKRGKGGPKGNEEQNLMRSIQEVSDLEEGRLGGDDLDLATETFMGQDKDKTIIIREEDYGDETSALLETDQINSRQMRKDQSSLLIGQKTDQAAKELNQMVKICVKEKQDDEKKLILKSLTNHFRNALAQQPGSLKTFTEKVSSLKTMKTVNDDDLDEEQEAKALQSIKASLMRQVMEAKQQSKDDLKKKNFIKKKNDGLQMIQAGIQIHKNMLMPQYQIDERLKVYREVNVPSDSLFMAVGYDGPVTDHAPIAGNRHYRKFYMDELENNKEIFKKSVFNHAPVMRGQSRGLKKGFFSNLFTKTTEDDSGQVSSLKEVGSFKGYIKVYNKETHSAFKKQRRLAIDELFSLLDTLHMKEHGKKFRITQQGMAESNSKQKLRHALHDMSVYSDTLFDFMLQSSYEDILQQSLSNPTQCLVRLYIIEAFDLASRDIGSDSDPYLMIKCGAFEYSGQDKYHLDEPNPKFHQSMEITATFPGAPPLEIELWDYDDLFGDDLIGKTLIDMDDRQFCQNWRQIEHKPIEYRELYHASSSMSQGSVICWLDIEESNKKKQASKQWDITPEPKKDYQLRVAVYDTKNVPMEDAEGTSDVFVKVFYGGGDPKETDTHWRCTTGTASFNYRILFDFEAPVPKNTPEGNLLRLQIFDRDIFKSNDFLCEFQMNLELLLKDCRLTQKPIHLNKKYYNSYFKDAHKRNKSVPPPTIQYEDEDSFWLSVKRDADSKPIKVRIDVRMIPGLDAKSQKLGNARSQPNNSPTLMEPYGRFKFSLNPLSMLGQMCGPEIKAKIMGYCGMITCVVILFLCLPMVFSDIISKLFLKMFGLA